MKTKKTVLTFLLCIGCAITIFVGCQENTDLIRSKLQSMFGDDFRGYYWPTAEFDNFGLGTSYSSKDGADPSSLKQDFICTIPVVLDKPTPTNQADQLNMYGYAVSAKGSAIFLSSDEQNDAALNLLLPQMFKLLDIQAGGGWTNGVVARVSFSDCYERFLIPDKFYNLIVTQTNSPSLTKEYKAGRLIVVSSDLLVYGLSVTLQATNGFGADLSASLDKAANSIISSNTSLTISVHHNSDGSFTLSNAQPAIVAMLYKSIPAPNKNLLLPITSPEAVTSEMLRQYWRKPMFRTLIDDSSLLK